MTKHDITWKSKFGPYKRFVNKYHRFPTMRDEFEDVKIGGWLRNQVTRYQKKVLPEAFIKQLDAFNPAWKYSHKEKEIINKDMLLSSDWILHVSNDEHPIDLYYSNESDIYECLKRNVYSCEQLIKNSNESWVKKSLSTFDIYSCYGILVPYLNAKYFKLLATIYNKIISSNINDTISFVEKFSFISREDMKFKMDAAMQSLEESERKILKMRYGLDGIQTQTLGYIAKKFYISREGVRQHELKAVRKLRHPKITETFEMTNSELDVLAISNRTRNNLYRKGLRTIADYIEYVSCKENIDKLKAIDKNTALDIINEKDACIMNAAISPRALSLPLSTELKNAQRARILKSMLLEVAHQTKS